MATEKHSQASLMPYVADRDGWTCHFCGKPLACRDTWPEWEPLAIAGERCGCGLGDQVDDPGEIEELEGATWRCHGRCPHVHQLTPVFPDSDTPPNFAVVALIVPKQFGGHDTLDNAVLACSECKHAHLGRTRARP